MPVINSLFALHSLEHSERFTELNRGEKRRGRKKIEVTRRKRGGIKRGESNLASNQILMWSPQPRIPRDVHRFT